MRVAWVGTHVSGFSRNRRLAEYLGQTGFDLEIIRVDLWPDDRIDAFSRGRLKIAVRALLVYPVLFVRLLLNAAPDLYLVSYPGWLDMPVVKLVALIKRRPVVFDVFISLFDTAVSDRGLADPRSALARVVRFVDRLALRSADVVIADCPAHGRFFSALAAKELRIEVLYLGANEEVFYPRLGISPETGRVLFFGTYVPLQGADWIVRAASRLRNREVNAYFVMIGEGQDRADTEALANTLSKDYISFQSATTQEVLVAEMHRASVVLGIFGTSDKANRVIPHKVFEAVACGRPVLTADTEAIREAFNGDEVAVCPPGDPDALADVLADLLADPDRLKGLASRARAAYEQRYSTDSQVERLGRILRSAIAEDGTKTANVRG